MSGYLVILNGEGGLNDVIGLSLDTPGNGLMLSCRNTRRVTVVGSNLALLAVTTCPATENSRSTEVLVAGMARYLRANRDKYGKRTACFFHHIRMFAFMHVRPRQTDAREHARRRRPPRGPPMRCPPHARPSRHPSWRLLPLQWAKKKKKSTNSNIGFHIGYSVCQPNRTSGAHWPISG